MGIIGYCIFSLDSCSEFRCIHILKSVNIPIYYNNKQNRNATNRLSENKGMQTFCSLNHQSITCAGGVHM